MKIAFFELEDWERAEREKGQLEGHEPLLSTLLINNARSGLIDPAALTKALDDGLLAGAALDVLEGEELLKDERQILAQSLAQDKLRTPLLNHSLLNRDNVVITPHIAFNSREAVQRNLETTLENLQAYLHGRPQNLIAS